LNDANEGCKGAWAVDWTKSNNGNCGKSGGDIVVDVVVVLGVLANPLVIFVPPGSRILVNVGFCVVVSFVLRLGIGTFP
jgi:hypothetical protein